MGLPTGHLLQNLVDLCTHYSIKTRDNDVSRASTEDFGDNRLVVECWRVQSKREWITLLGDSYRAPSDTVRLELLPCTLVLSRFSASVLYSLKQLYTHIRLSKEAIVFTDRVGCELPDYSSAK